MNQLQLNPIQALRNVIGLVHPAPPSRPDTHIPQSQSGYIAPIAPIVPPQGSSPQSLAFFNAALQSYQAGRAQAPRQSVSLGRMPSPNLGVSTGGNLQQFQGNKRSYGLQGGNFDPGATPLQNSGFGPSGNPQIARHINPQVKDNGYNYYN